MATATNPERHRWIDGGGRRQVADNTTDDFEPSWAFGFPDEPSAPKPSQDHYTESDVGTSTLW